MGDGKTYFNPEEPSLNREPCKRCLRKPKRNEKPPPPPPTTTTPTTTPTTTRDEFFEDEIDTTAEPELEKRERRSYMELERYGVLILKNKCYSLLNACYISRFNLNFFAPLCVIYVYLYRLNC